MKTSGEHWTAYLVNVDLPSSASRCFPATPARGGFPFSTRLSKKWRVSACIYVYIVERRIRKKANPPLLLWLFYFLHFFFFFFHFFFPIFHPLLANLNISSRSLALSLSLSFTLVLIALVLIFIIFYSYTQHSKVLSGCIEYCLNGGSVNWLYHLARESIRTQPLEKHGQKHLSQFWLNTSMERHLHQAHVTALELAPFPELLKVLLYYRFWIYQN